MGIFAFCMGIFHLFLPGPADLSQNGLSFPFDFFKGSVTTNG